MFYSEVLFREFFPFLTHLFTRLSFAADTRVPLDDVMERVSVPSHSTFRRTG
jgi:hypothetical protein